MVLLGAPRELVAFGAAVLAAELPVTLVNAIWWKMSVHSAVAAGCTAVLALGLGPWWLLVAGAVALNGWSRIHLRAHTLAQVVVGALSGFIASGAVFALMR
jgi:hypothetical protein